MDGPGVTDVHVDMVLAQFLDDFIATGVAYHVEIIGVATVGCFFGKDEAAVCQSFPIEGSDLPATSDILFDLRQSGQQDGSLKFI